MSQRPTEPVAHGQSAQTLQPIPTETRHPQSSAPVSGEGDDRSLKRARPGEVLSLPSATRPRTGPSPRRGDDEKHRADRVRVYGLLDEYRARMRELKAAGQRKDDMVAAKEFRDQGKIPAKRMGHPLGIIVGDHFGCKGEMVVAGVHGNIMSGIDARDGIAYAIVLSGGYEGDDDGGEEFIYSGTGGQSKSGPSDQSFEQKQNKALKVAVKTKGCIRVARKRGDKDYVYDGLYQIVDAWMEENPSTKTKVCKFKFRGIPGESMASAKVKVSNLYFGKSRLVDRVEKIKKQVLVKKVSPLLHSGPRRMQEGRTKMKHKGYGYMATACVVKQLELSRLNSLKTMNNICSFDISSNKESLRIPAVGAIAKGSSWTRDFEYVTQPKISAAAQAIIDDSRKKIGCVSGCQHKTISPYTKDGLLRENVPEGVYACPSTCNLPACRSNRSTSGGILYPLEIFETAQKGFGVRCSVDIPGGAFVCEYIGELITDVEAELVEDDSYLFGLDHFLLMKEAQLSGMQICDSQSLPPVPFSDDDMIKQNYHGHYLVMNAHKVGNIGRYINHSCGSSQNLVIQFVLGEGHNSLYHRICFFASCDIPANTELVYDYGYKEGSVEGKKMKCYCTSSECRGALL